MELALTEALPDLLQHLFQNIGDFNELLRVRFRQPDLQTLGALRYPPEQVCDPFELVTESEACKKFARFQFSDLRYRRGELLIYLLLDAIKLLFAVPHSQKRHLRGIGQEFPDVERGITGNQTCVQGNLRQPMCLAMMPILKCSA